MSTFQTHNTRSSTSGFTLVETLVAVFLLTLALAAALTAMYSSIKASTAARDQVTAFYLAQDAFEYIKNVRDTNDQSGASWDNRLDPCMNQYCVVDTTRSPSDLDAISACAPSTDHTECAVLSRETGDGWYGYNSGSGWEQTRFRRSVYIEPTGYTGSSINSNELRITITVSWTQGIDTHRFSVTEYITDWQP